MLSQFGYTLRGDGKRTAISEQIVNADAGRVSSRSLTYAYDDAGKLTGERGQNGLGYNYENLWEYDAVGNRTGTTARSNDVAGATQEWAHATVVTSQFNDNDQLTSQTSVVDGASTVTQNYGYDANGAEKTVASKSGNTNTGSSVNGWDFEGKLRTTQAKDAEGADNGGSSNAFDAMGDRLWHVADVGKPSQKTTSYVVDTAVSYHQVVEESSHDVNDGAGVARLQARYVWGQGLAPLAMWRRGSDGAFKLFYFVSDGQDSVRQLTSASGEVTDSYFYDAWGKGLAGGSGNTANPFRYTGQQLDSDGRYYLRARFYDPGNGRFLSHDALMGDDEDPISLHRYLYAWADSVNGCDPSGDVNIPEIQISIDSGLKIEVGTWSTTITLRSAATWLVSQIIRGTIVNAIAKALGLPPVLVDLAANPVRGTLAGMGRWGLRGIARFWVHEAGAQVPTMLEAEAVTLLQNGGTYNGIVRPLLNNFFTGFGRNPRNVFGALGQLEWHHIVEQEAEEAAAGISRKAINSIVNIVPVPRLIHEQISALYSSGTAEVQQLGYSTVRDYIKTLTWEQQWSYGLAVYQAAMRGSGQAILRNIPLP